MRSFAIFIGLFVIGFAVMAIATYPLYTLLTPQFDVAFHRVGTRLGMLVLLIGFTMVARRLALDDRASLGYGLPRAAFLREAALGLALGVVTMSPIAALMFALDLRTWSADFTPTAANIAALLLQGASSGLAVALIEETFMRGAMHSAIARESGTRTAIVLTALLYSATHFIGRMHIAPENVGPWSGVELIRGTLAAFADPSVIFDAFLCLALVGALLGMVRQITGNIAACIGLHAGWVWVITWLRETSAPNDAQPWRMLLSQFDGVVGWLVAAWTLIIGFALHAFYVRRVASGVGASEQR